MGNLFTWKLHGDGKTLAPGEVVEPDERLTWTRTIGIGAQHVIAMFGATFLVPILTHFDPSTTLFFTAMSTALFLLINKNVLPSYLGSSFGFIAPIAAVASAGKGIPAASFGIMVTGLLLALVGVAVHFAGAKWIDIIMPPVVNGAIVAIIGFNLAPSVWSNWQKGWDTALVTLLAVLLIAVLFRGLVGRLNILLGVIVGYVYACFRGQVDFSAIGDAAWIGFPKFHLPQVDFSILPMFIPVVLVLVAENVGHVKSVAQMTGRDYDGHMGTALFADGLGTAIAGFGGGSGTTTSRAAPAMRPAFRASIRASWSMAVPRPTFTTMASRGSRAMRSRLRMPTVSATDGRAITRISVSGSTWSSCSWGSIRS